MFGLLGPLVELAALQVSVIVSSRANDPRSAQQLTGLLILPITLVFVAQLMGAVHRRSRRAAARRARLPRAQLVLLWVGVRVFQRETILTRWR